MSKLNTEGRLAAYELCQKRDGHRCKRCRKGPKTVGPLKVDHIDNDPHNNPKNGKNWQLLCHACNIKKNPRGPGRRGIDARHRLLSLEKERERESERDGESERIRARTMEMQRNIDCEPKFKTWIEGMIGELSSLDVNDLVNAAANYVGCSQQTIRRYLDKVTSFTGEYEYYTDEEGKRRVRARSLPGKSGEGVEKINLVASS